MLRLVKLLKQILDSEKGQALPIVLALLVIGGLVLAPSLRYATDTLNSSRILEEGVKGVYAAEAGVEYAIWYIGKYGSQPDDGALLENINRMPVSFQTLETGYFVLYLGELIENDGGHVDWLTVDGVMEWDEGAGAYKYTITITWEADPGTPPIKLLEVGARIPVGYEYQPDSAALFAENLSLNNPEPPYGSSTQDGQDAWLLNWELGSPRPEISEADTTKTQTFYITGAGDQTGHYGWIAAKRTDIGQVGEIEGIVYEITATATRPEDGRTTARVVAEVMIGGGMTNILSWQISG